MQNPKFPYAMELLEYFKKRTVPDKGLLEKLYGASKTDILQKQIGLFFENNYKENFVIRKHDYEAPVEIYNTRTNLEQDLDYQKIHNDIIEGREPELYYLRKFYGNFSEQIQFLYSKYLKYNLKRRCELPAASHLNRVAGVAIKLNFNSDGSFKYGAVAGLHDVIEDLFPVIKDENGNHYDFEHYKDFIEKYIPEEVREEIKILSNHYDMILAYVVKYLRDTDKAMTKNNILDMLKYMTSKEQWELNKYIRKMIVLIEKDNSLNEKEIIDDIKWKCYYELYLNGIATASKSMNNFRLFEIKGIDLLDNFHGKDVLSVDGRIRNIKKNIMWAKLGYSLSSTWMPLNNHIRECMEDAFVAAECIVLRDLLQEQSSIDFVMAGLIKFKKLEDVFYIS
ncbi:MAG: hypothetical protein N2490_04420 [Ignavibacteria bacterium]|nr:hypothetical protein [Ignavibacteria bacterium]